MLRNLRNLRNIVNFDKYLYGHLDGDIVYTIELGTEQAERNS